MSSVDVLEHYKEIIAKYIPDADSVEFEGPEIAIYSKNRRDIITNGDALKNLAREIRKRVVIRAHPSIRAPAEDAMAFIQQEISQDAEISKITFDANLGEVIIAAKKPGLVIGKGGQTLKLIREKTLWRPNVVRTPPIESKTVDSVRELLKKEKETQKKYLLAIGHRIHRPCLFKNTEVRLTTLGGFREVGRTCLLLQTKESNVMIDCGVSLSSPNDEFPRLDLPEFDLERLDAVVITHAHMDHCGFVPYLYKWGYRGPVFETQPTRNLATMLQLDYVDIADKEGRDAIYTKKDIKKEILSSIPLEYKEVTDIAPDVKLTFHNSGHILGSAMAHLHVGDGNYNIVYTGDFKFQRTKLLEPASYKFPRLETIVIEATYGGPHDVMQSRLESERYLVNLITEVVNRKGKILIPCLAVGRAQEIMIVLEELLGKRIPDIPVFIDGMIIEATAIHTTHPEYLSEELQEKIFHQGHNPFLCESFHQIDSQNAREDVVEGDPCIILATSGMLQGGPAVQYLEKLGDDPANCLLFVSYQAENTLGRRIQKGWREFTAIDEKGKRRNVRINLQVETIEGFSGHSSRSQIMGYLRKLRPKPDRVITCHGEANKCVNLASTVHQRVKCETRAPKNMESIYLN
ncbi:MAG TPA: beta-CASP ribonuclease aCPSF1 [Candidatus Lokiarchaeia archaeon]|nr:beta-CASP ribonuclease aCPSF1 [Candidatus Lokiarchaeia archaeon]